jgi:hypothetical protein
MNVPAERYVHHVMSHRRRLVEALADARSWQNRALADAIRENADTAFGRRHGFAHLDGDVRAFRRAVPIQDGASVAPWLDRVASGERAVLTAEDPVVFFESSGSTGRTKQIPVTPAFVRRCFMPPFYAAWANLVEHYPEAIARPDATFNLRHDPGQPAAATASGRPHLGASQVDFARAFGEELSAEPGSAAPWGRLPADLAGRDPLERTYLRARLAAEHEVRCLIGINPAMVAALARQIGRWGPLIVQELHDGTVGGLRHGSPNPDRARELERMMDAFGVLQPRHVWPGLRVILCWNTGVASLYMANVRESFGAARVLPAPVAASEAFVAVALDRHATAASITVANGFYEFVDADEDVRPDSDTLLFDELVAGREYQVIVTHVGGLYRYVIGDVVRVIDRAMDVPRVEYAGRNAPASIAGERLRESQAIEALRAALESGGLGVHNASFRPVAGSGMPRYDLAIAPTEPVTDAEAAVLQRALDDRLRAVCASYGEARDRGRLDAPRAHVVTPDAFLDEWERRVAAGARPSQVKDRVFERDEDAWRRLLGPGEPQTRVPRTRNARGTSGTSRGATGTVHRP